MRFENMTEDERIDNLERLYDRLDRALYDGKSDFPKIDVRRYRRELRMCGSKKHQVERATEMLLEDIEGNGRLTAEALVAIKNFKFRGERKKVSIDDLSGDQELLERAKEVGDVDRYIKIRQLILLGEIRDELELITKHLYND